MVEAMILVRWLKKGYFFKKTTFSRYFENRKIPIFLESCLVCVRSSKKCYRIVLLRFFFMKGIVLQFCAIISDRLTGWKMHFWRDYVISFIKDIGYFVNGFSHTFCDHICQPISEEFTFCDSF